MGVREKRGNDGPFTFLKSLVSPLDWKEEEVSLNKSL